MNAISNKTSFVILCAIILLGAFFRFFQLYTIPPGLYPDEAMNGNNALETLATNNYKIFYPENNGREGLFINIQALSITLFGAHPWALRIVSALLGTLTILGVYLLTKELFRKKIPESEVGSLARNVSYAEIVALLSSFFIATSYWHINFSRIGFRAIAVPFFSAFGLYFLLKGLRTGKIWDLVWAGIFIGLGFHTYIAFRFIPFVIAIPILFYLWQWWTTRGSAFPANDSKDMRTSCSPCAVLLFLFITFVVALPIGIYFLKNPGDFLGRGGQVSTFSAESPIQEFAKSATFTAGMLFVWGDCNWRHNFDCRPELHPLVALFFLIGIITAIKALRQKQSELAPTPHTLLVWCIFMTFPATLTREGLPHALRSIGLIPPVMILAGWGGAMFLEYILRKTELDTQKLPEFFTLFKRMQQKLIILFALLLLFIPFTTYRTYFIKWAYATDTYYAFGQDLWNIGVYLRTLPEITEKFIVVNFDGGNVRGVPMPAQSIMFATDTFREDARRRRRFHYILPSQIDAALAPYLTRPVIIVMLNSRDREFIQHIERRFPQFKISIREDFVVMQNYEEYK